MFVAVLTASRARPVLNAAMATALRDAWGGGPLRWLSGGVAVEFDMPVRRDPREARAGLGAMGVDLNVLPAEGRRKRLLLADMDGTMIGQECIDELAAEAGMGDRVSAITARAMDGALDFEAALRERVGLLAGLDVAAIDRVLADRITLAPGGDALVATMKAHGARTALVSGGFTAFTAVVARRLGFDSHRANVLEVEDRRLTGRPGAPILGAAAKVEELDRLVAERGIARADAAAVGDGANDLAMIGAAGLGVAIHAKPTVRAVAEHVVDHGDLTALLYLQGYRDEEFTVPSP